MPRLRDRRGPAVPLVILTLLRDPVLASMALFGVLTALWYLGDVGGTALQFQLLWPVQSGMDLVFCVLARRVGRLAGPGPPRRFWWVLSASGLSLAIGDGAQAVLMLRDPSADKVDGGLVQAVFMIAGLGAMVVNMLLYPTSISSPRERLRFWLDSATVLVAGAVLAWYFIADPATAANSDVVTKVLAASVVLVAAFGAVKIVLSRAAPVTRSAAAPMVLAALAEALSTLMTPDGPTASIAPGALALRLAPSVLIAFAPRIYELQVRADPSTFSPRPPRPYSLLPYAAVAMTFVLMLRTMPVNLGVRVWGVVTGVVVITALVVARQLMSFHDNIGLIRRLDATLLDLRGHERRLREQAWQDGLTGLSNRTAFAEIGAEALGRDRDRPRCALLLIDLDDFKTVNDTLGHATGDALLVAVADRLRAAVRPEDIVARLGGDEFAVLLTGVDVADSTALADRILAAVARPVRVDDHALSVRASIGIAPAIAGDDLAQLLRNADIAMYAAKDGGKSNYLWYAPDMGARILQTANLGTRLREAIDREQFDVVYQPIVRLDTGQIVGVEALMRWDDPVHGSMPPLEFIPIAERTGLIVPLGRWILDRACRQAVDWRAEHPAAATVRMNVNVAGRQLREPGFVDEVAAVLARSGLAADQLTIEITETAVLQDAETVQTLHSLKRLGVGLALDDFGTAASSLGLLLTCPVSVLKLDRSFVAEVTTAARQSAVATAVIQMARALDLSAVAEGIETAEQAEFLRGLGYRQAQGFLFSAPLPAEELARRWLAAPVGDDRVAPLVRR